MPSRSRPGSFADAGPAGPPAALPGGRRLGRRRGAARRGRRGVPRARPASGGGRSGAPGGDGTPPPLALDGYSGAHGHGSTGGTAGIAPGEPNPYGVTYRADGTLPAGPGSAPVYWAEGKVTRAEVARLAKALGLAGTPAGAGTAWRSAPAGDGRARSCGWTRQAPGTWTFSRYPAGRPTTAQGTPVVRAQGSGSEPEPRRPGERGGGEEGRGARAEGGRPGRREAGREPGHGHPVRVVNADPVVGGLPTYGWTTGLRISAQGEVVGGSGQLKAPVKGDTYPVLGAKKTLDLMNGSAPATADRRMGIGGCASPVPLKDRLEAPCEHASTPAPKPETVTVEKAVFGLASHARGRAAGAGAVLAVRGAGAGRAGTPTR